MGDCSNTGYCDPATGVYHLKPDQAVGNELYYGFNWGDWLTAESDTLDTITWSIPAGLTNMAEAINGSIAYVKLSAAAAGDYEISCTITCHEGSATQKKTKSAVITFF